MLSWTYNLQSTILEIADLAKKLVFQVGVQ